MTWKTARLDLDVPQGSTFDPQLTVYLADGATPRDLSGWDARMQVRDGLEASTPVLSLTVGSGITLGGAQGTIDLLATDTQTKDLTAKAYDYDLELIEPSGKIRRPLAGKFIVGREVTR
jgi:hypothetical protein